jgi:hypothetical protein
MKRIFFLISSAICVIAAMPITTNADAAEVAIATAKPAVAAVVAPVAAAGGTGATTNVTIPNSSNNYLDDRLSWPNAIEAKATLGGQLADGYCIPANTRLIGARSAMDTDASSTTSGSPPQYQATTLAVPSPFWKAVDVFSDYSYLQGTGNQQYVAAPADGAAKMCPHVNNPKPLYEGTIAYVSADDMKYVGSRSGFDYGALVVPFKVQLSGGKAFTGSSSLGGYLGYQNPVGDLGMNVSPIIFAGASNISTSATTGFKTTSQTVAGLSYGAGLLFNIKDSFQAGFVVGFDHVNSAQKYQYNDKPWVSFEIGYSFAN